MSSNDLVTRLFAALAHGDEEHRAWLKDAIDAFFADKPIPAPRGSGNKEAHITTLEAEIEGLREALRKAVEYDPNIAEDVSEVSAALGDDYDARFEAADESELGQCSICGADYLGECPQHPAALKGHKG